jgi:TfoX/Sxy family transcriptional regulator of competence genes
MILDFNTGCQNPHFNLYAEEAGRLVLMTDVRVLRQLWNNPDKLSRKELRILINKTREGMVDAKSKERKK